MRLKINYYNNAMSNSHIKTAHAWGVEQALSQAGYASYNDLVKEAQDLGLLEKTALSPGAAGLGGALAGGLVGNRMSGLPGALVSALSGPVAAGMASDEGHGLGGAAGHVLGGAGGGLAGGLAGGLGGAGLGALIAALSDGQIDRNEAAQLGALIGGAAGGLGGGAYGAHQLANRWGQK